MARRITEEKLTKAILNWLEANNWEIICYDFPQSGTGILIHANAKKASNKNKGGFIPDIVAYKDNIVVFFENKDRFVLEDYQKVNFLRNTNNYAYSIAKLLIDFPIQKIYYGIGIPNSKYNQQKDKKYWELVDFTIMINLEFSIEVIYDPNSIF